MMTELGEGAGLGSDRTGGRAGHIQGNYLHSPLSPCRLFMGYFKAGGLQLRILMLNLIEWMGSTILH